MEGKIYQILKKHKLPLKKREEVLTDLLLLFDDSVSVCEHNYNNMRLKSETPKVDLNMYVEGIDSYKVNDNTNSGIAYFVDKFHKSANCTLTTNKRH